MEGKHTVLGLLYSLEFVRSLPAEQTYHEFPSRLDFCRG